MESAEVLRVLQEHPEWERPLREMVERETAHPVMESLEGWEWRDVHTSPATINAMVAAGVVDSIWRSRTYSYYRLHDLEATRAALEFLGDDVDPPAEPSVDAGSMFASVVGHERIKFALKTALRAEHPVHCLLVSEPGMAKTLFLEEIAALPGAHYYAGSNTTKSGLVSLLLAERPSYLLLDEIDKMDERDTHPLLGLMETGKVTRLQHKAREQVTLETRVFAACNRAERIPAPVLSRFVRLEMPAYAPEEFRSIVVSVLARKYGYDQDTARDIAQKVSQHSTSVRDAVNVAKLANGDSALVDQVVACLFPNGAVG